MERLGEFSYYEELAVKDTPENAQKRKGLIGTVPQVYRLMTENARLRNLSISVRTAASEFREARSTEYEEQYESKLKGLKKKLPCVAFGGVFGKARLISEVKSVSGLFCIDLDHVDQQGYFPEDLKKAIAEDTELAAVLVFRSPSGDGVKGACRFKTEGLFKSSNPKDWNRDFGKVYSGFARYFKEKYSLELDDKTKDISRACFLCHDPSAIYNETDAVFDWEQWYIEEPLQNIQPYVGETNGPVRNFDSSSGKRFVLLNWDGSRPYGGKQICPNCGRVSLTPYVDTKTGLLLGYNTGKCEHLNHCRYFYKDSDLFRDRPDIKEQFFPSGSDKGTKSNKKTKKLTSDISKSWRDNEVCTIPDEYKTRTIGRDSDFMTWLAGKVGKVCAERVAERYQIGADLKGNVIFWQVDINGAVRDGKIMAYNPFTGHRMKDENGQSKGITWVGFDLQRRGVLPAEWKRSQCLFGEHLLKDREGKPVYVVESEKTALVCAALVPDAIWLSTCECKGLTAQRCEALRHIDFTIFPDAGAFDTWKRMAGSVAMKLGCKIKVDKTVEERADEKQNAAGWDLADFLLLDLENGKL